MNITTAKISKILIKEYNWIYLGDNGTKMIKDILTIIDKELKFHKNISIKNKTK